MRPTQLRDRRHDPDRDGVRKRRKGDLDRLRGDDDDHPDPAVERRPKLDIVDPAERAEEAHDRGHRPPRAPW